MITKLVFSDLQSNVKCIFLILSRRKLCMCIFTGWTCCIICTNMCGKAFCADNTAHHHHHLRSLPPTHNIKSAIDWEFRPISFDTVAYHLRAQNFSNMFTFSFFLFKLILIQVCAQRRTDAIGGRQLHLLIKLRRE